MAIDATDDYIILTDISSWADLPARTKREQIVRSLGNLQSRMRQYITNVDRVATHLSDQGQDAGAFLEEEERLLNQFVDMRASSNTGPCGRCTSTTTCSPAGGRQANRAANCQEGR